MHTIRVAFGTLPATQAEQANGPADRLPSRFAEAVRRPDAGAPEGASHGR